MGKQEFQLFYQRHLPHYQPPGATVFITYRLTGSLPKEIVLRLKEEIHAREIGIQKIANPIDRNNAAISAWKKHFANWDLELDHACLSPRWLAEPQVAGLVCDALKKRDGYEYHLDAYCVMPNHVHIVCTPLQKGDEYYFLPKILQSLKGYTAWEANKLLNRKGQFWQHESYDHVIRDNDEFLRVVNYVLENPARAGLPVRWTYLREGILQVELSSSTIDDKQVQIKLSGSIMGDLDRSPYIQMTDKTECVASVCLNIAGKISTEIKNRLVIELGLTLRYTESKPIVPI